MSVEIKIPDVAESITEVTVGAWLKEDGEEVEQDEFVVEVETDKASQELPAEASGILKILVEEGETVEVGAVIARIEPKNESKDSGSSSKKESKEDKAQSSESKQNKNKSESSDTQAKDSKGEVIEMKVTELGESITEVTIGEWLKDDGDFVEMDESLCEVETDKATQEMPAEASGILRHVAKEGDTLAIGELICKIEVTEKPANADENDSESEHNSEKEASSESKSQNKSDKQSYATGHASPAAAKILAEKGINPEDVKGTGVDGRITKEDAEKAEKPQEKPSKKEDKTTSQDTQKTSGNREQRRKRMSTMRKTIARRLVSVKNDTAMLTTFNEVDMKPVMDLRKKYKEMFKEKHNVGLGFMSFFAKACAQALLEVEGVNAQIDGNEMVYNNYVDISVAVSTPKGLVVPVLRNVETLSFAGVEQGIIDLAVKARDGKLTIDEMQGGTFTITNGGIFGSMMSTPIINAPQSAILGMHNIVKRAVVINDEIVIRPMMYLALSYDHRIIDGKEAVTFLVKVKQYIEEPERLLIGL